MQTNPAGGHGSLPHAPHMQAVAAQDEDGGSGEQCWGRAAAGLTNKRKGVDCGGSLGGAQDALAPLPGV